jgi:hypothetical protein
MGIKKNWAGCLAAVGVTGVLAFSGVVMTAGAASAAEQPAPAPKAAVVQGDRVEGPFTTRVTPTEKGVDGAYYYHTLAWKTSADGAALNHEVLYPRFGAPLSTAVAAEYEGATAAAAEHFSFPAPGTQGPIVNSAGLCLNAASTQIAGLSFKPCADTAQQQFLLETNGAIKAIAINGYMTERGSSQADFSTVHKTQAQTDVVNMAILTPVAAPATVVDVTGPAGTVDTPRPVISGTGEPGATITVKDKDGTTIGTGTVGDDGTWEITPTVNLPEGNTTVTVEQDADGEKSTDDHSFVIDILSPVIAVVDSIDNDNMSAELSGTGEPGATIVITTPTGDHETTVKPDGTWTITAPGLAKGQNTIPVKQLIDGEPAGETSVTVITEQNPPIAHPAAIAAALAAGAGILIPVIRRRRAHA